MEYIVLNNGIKCPVVGIGTFMLSPRRRGEQRPGGPEDGLFSCRYRQCLCQ